ncbi:MAG: hypothetical protein ACREC4_05425 [Methylocella sp.]
MVGVKASMAMQMASHKSGIVRAAAAMMPWIGANKLVDKEKNFGIFREQGRAIFVCIAPEADILNN